jgi:hypothetical protein
MTTLDTLANTVSHIAGAEPYSGDGTLGVRCPLGAYPAVRVRLALAGIRSERTAIDHDQSLVYIRVLK